MPTKNQKVFLLPASQRLKGKPHVRRSVDEIPATSSYRDCGGVGVEVGIRPRSTESNAPRERETKMATVLEATPTNQIWPRTAGPNKNAMDLQTWWRHIAPEPALQEP